jgi:predicted metal-dependent hydrolase
VTAPRFFGLQAIEDFVMKHSSWVRARVEETRGRSILRIRRSDIPALKKQALALAIARAEHFAAYFTKSPKTPCKRQSRTRVKSTSNW